MEDKLIDKIIKDKVNNEDIKIPESIDLKLKNAYEIIEKTDIKVEKKKLYSKKKIIKRTALAAGLIFGFLGFATINPAFAENIPGIGSLVKYLNNAYSFNSNMGKYADSKNIVQNKNNMEVSLESVIYDESSLKFIYTVTSKEKLQWGVQMRNTSLKINGKEIMKRDKTDWRKDNEDRIDDVKIEDIKDGGQKYAVINNYDISDLKLDKDINIDWTINEIHLHDGKYNKGPWNFKFKTSKEKLMGDTKVINVNHEYDVEGYKYTLDKIIITPIEMKVLATKDTRVFADLEEAKKKIESKFKGEKVDPHQMSIERINSIIEKIDNTKENQELIEKYYKLRKVEDKMTGFQMGYFLNEKGEMAIPLSGSGSNGKNIDLYKGFKETPKKITFIPRNNVRAYGDNDIKQKEQIFKDKYIEVPISDFKAGAEFRQGENMSMLIKSAENKDNTLTLNVDYKGDFKNYRRGYEILLVPTNRSLEEKIDKNFYEQNDDVIRDKRSLSNEEIEKYEDAKYTFKLEEGKEYKVWLEQEDKDSLDRKNQIIVDVK